MNNMRVRQILQQFFIAVVVFSLLCPGNLWAKRKGAQLQIIKLDGDIIEGELLRVKENSLLLMTSVSGTAIDINEIDEIKIKKRKTKSGKGAAIGAGVGFVIGGVIGGSRYTEVIFDGGSPTFGNRMLVGSITGALCAIPCALLGASIGGSIPAGYKTAETIDVKRAHPHEIKYILKKLKKKARFKN
ncbi:MAG: hypothetical protein JSV88_08490 [Candidatus Aminicenantes bacterium]|nr:MAG: hypothetical protein JSV88_08490 [Candidatus Aminicenantes bacterium]